MKQLSKNSSTFFFVFLTGVLIVITFISYNKILQYNKSVDEMMRISKVKRTLSTILENVKDAEIEHRAYLLTGDTTYLHSYKVEQKVRNIELDSLIFFTSNDARQLKNLRELKAAIRKRYAIMNTNLFLANNNYRTNEFKEALNRGNMKMREVRAQIAIMIQTENKIIAERAQAKDRTAAVTPIFLLAVSLFSIIIITFFFFRLQKETSERILISESNRLLQEAKDVIEIKEKRFRTLSANLPHMIWTATADGRKNYFNKYFLDYTGFTFEDLEGYGWQRVIFPADLEIEVARWNESLKTGQDFSFEKRVRHHSGTYRWHLNHGIAQRDAAGNIIGWIGTSTEIEDQKKVTELLAKTEEQFRTFANTIQNLAWIAGSDGEIYWYNQRWYDYTGETAEEMKGWGWTKVHHPEYVEKLVEQVKNFWKKEEPFELTFPLRRFDGEYRWFLTRVSPLIGDDGKVERWIGSNTDITEQKSFSEELEEQVKERTEELKIQNQTFEVAEKIAKMGSYNWDIDNNTLRYSDNLFRLLDCEPQEFVPTFEKFLSFIHPDDLEEVTRNREKTIENEKLVETPYRVITKKGVIKHLRSAGNFTSEGETRLLIGTVQDITEDVRASTQLVEQNLELEKANAELASFNYIASHDLQEPLRKIQAFSKRIINEEAINFSERGKDYFSRISKAAERMQKLILSLLEFSRANSSEMVFMETDLNQTLHEVKANLRELITGRNAKIVTEELPTIIAIPIQMNQLFLNLISNSIKYSKDNVDPQIFITSEKINFQDTGNPVGQKGLFWKISFTDNGIGFEQQYENKIFEVFQRLHGKTEYEGTGIGLAICKKIVVAHQGSISAIGRPGIGSTFTIFLRAIEQA